MNNDPTISDALFNAALRSMAAAGPNPAPARLRQSRLDALVGAACATCRHYGAEHLFSLGPVKLCMSAGCACGRRALMALWRTLRPFWAILAAGAYFGAHAALWALQGFPVRP